MNAQEFIAKWRRVELTERSAAQQHFLDLCELLGQDPPAKADPIGESFCFERGVKKLGGEDGWADVWKKGFFGWEYKGRHKCQGRRESVPAGRSKSGPLRRVGEPGRRREGDARPETAWLVPRSQTAGAGGSGGVGERLRFLLSASR